ncbi:MAG: hypothetical protein EXQ87_07580 [Alphaproteobacteria bacterium]|nr:hypothetical protein [Alphaproteobacteria bacterium]
MAYIITATGTLTVVTPIAVSPPDHEDKRGNKRLHRLARVVEYRDGNPVNVPVIPASTFRGVMRHAISGLAFTEQLSGGGAPFTVNDYVNTAQGGVVDRKAEGEDKPLDFSAAEEIRRRNPIMGLFGNFSDKMPSRLMMRHAALDRPDDIFEVAAQVRTDPVERDADLRRMFSGAELDAFSKQMEARRQLVRIEERIERIENQVARIKKGDEEADPEEVKTLQAELKKENASQGQLAKGAGGSVNLQQITPRAEAIAPGATLRHGFTLNGVTETEAAIALLAIETWVAGGARLGAMRRSGYGVLDGFYDLVARPAYGVARLSPPLAIGRIFWKSGGNLEIEPAGGTIMATIMVEKARIIGGSMREWELRAG